MASPRTPICDWLGIRHPIFGFSHSVEVVAAIARAGGFPVLGLARELPHEIPEILARVDALMDGLPYGIDLMLPSNVPQQASVEGLRESLPPAHVEFVEGLRRRFHVEPPDKPSFFTTQVRSESLFEAQIEAVLASNALGVATAIGLRPDLIERARTRGKITFSLVGSVRHAQKALQMGVQVLVAQGHDAGGHTGPVGTMSLLPQIIAVAGNNPVLAAGGIATGAQVLGSIAMGAQGAWLGTLWLAAKENHTPPALLKKLIEGNSEDTLITRAHSGKPCRVVRSEWIDAWAEAGAPQPLGMPLQQVLTGDVFASIHEHDNERLIYEAAGQSIFAIRRETTVAEQFAELVADMEGAWQRLEAMQHPARHSRAGGNPVQA
jgi:NAD(P)H-dependent flavin oxidoreductase YrpB (nitropropane dioxygenase family)